MKQVETINNIATKLGMDLFLRSQQSEDLSDEAKKLVTANWCIAYTKKLMTPFLNDILKHNRYGNVNVNALNIKLSDTHILKIASLAEEVANQDILENA